MTITNQFLCFRRKHVNMHTLINPNMVLLAREARGFSQSALAAKINSYKTNISRLEHGNSQADEETLMALSAATNYPPRFFLQQGDILPVNLSYRKRRQVAAKLITPVEAQINIIRRHAQFISRSVSRSVPQLTAYEITGLNAPAKAAARVRKKWQIPPGPVSNLVTVLEQQGIMISSFEFGTNSLNSRSMLTDDEYPVIFLNRTMPGDRQRFSLAFELGHLIMHTFCAVPHHRYINHEANLFAAELLMPAKEILKDFKPGITLPLRGELKRKWKVSMIALLYRADDLGLLAPNQKRYLLQQFNNLKIRRREPKQLDIQAEQPQLMQQLLKQFIRKNKITTLQMAALLAVEMDDYQKYYP